MGCTHTLMVKKYAPKMKELSFLGGSDSNAFFIDKKYRLWKKRTETEPSDSIKIELRHLRIMNLPKSDYILQPVCIVRESPTTTLMCMDYAGTDLFEYMYRRPYTSKCMQKHLEHIRDAIHFLHDNGIAHRDIKPENVVFHKGIPKLIDWDFSSCLYNFHYCGTINYMVNKLTVKKWKCSNTIKSKRMDVYAFGKLIFSVLLSMVRFEPNPNKLFVLHAFFNEKFLKNPYTGDWGKWANIALKCCKYVEHIPE